MLQTLSSLFGFGTLPSLAFSVAPLSAPHYTPRPRFVAPSKAKAKAARIRALQRQARRIQRQAAR